MLVLGTAYCMLAWQWTRPRWRRTRYAYAIAAVLLVGVPATFIDLAVFAGFYDDGQTTTISVSDYNACNWLRNSTPQEAIAQGLPEYPNAYYRVTPISVIGARRVALGRYQNAAHDLRPPAEFQQLKADIQSLFEPERSHRWPEVLDRYGISYVYLGEHEKAWQDPDIAEYYEAESRFARVYSQDGVDIFQYLPSLKRK